MLLGVIIPLEVPEPVLLFVYVLASGVPSPLLHIEYHCCLPCIYTDAVFFFSFTVGSMHTFTIYNPSSFYTTIWEGILPPNIRWSSSLWFDAILVMPTLIALRYTLRYAFLRWYAADDMIYACTMLPCWYNCLLWRVYNYDSWRWCLLILYSSTTIYMIQCNMWYLYVIHGGSVFCMIWALLLCGVCSLDPMLYVWESGVESVLLL